MPRSHVTWITLFAVVAAVLSFGARRAKADPTAADLLPASSVLYVEIERPKDLLGLLLDHPLRKKLEESPDYQKAWNDPKLKELQGAVAALEKRSGVPWRKALEASAGGGVGLAFDAKTQGIVMLLRAEDRKTADAVRDALLGLARDDATAKGNPDPFVVQDYRGLTAYKAGESLVGNVGNWTVVCNKEDLAKSVADTFLDGVKANKGETLAGDKEFIDARRDGQGAAKPTAWVFVRLGPLRMMAGSNPLFDKKAKSEDAGAELILGGLVGPLRNAPYATASLILENERVKLAVSSPNDPKWLPEERTFFFPPAGSGDGGAAQPLRPKGTILSLSAYRDLAAWWAAGPDLLSEGAAAKMAQADSGLSTFLGGKSFGTDVLGALRPQIDIIIASQDFKAAGVPEPGIKLPAFAMAFRLKDKQAAGAQLRKHFRVAFQSLVALGNLDGSAKGRPMLTMSNEKRGKAEILSAEYDADAMMEAGDAQEDADAKPAEASADPKPGNAKDKPGDADPAAPAEQGIHFNFSPALVISKDHLIFCSTRQIAQELADLAAKEGSAENLKRLPQNTLIQVAAEPIAELLKANREQLVAKNVLEKGHEREAAEKEVDLLLKLVAAVRDARLSLTPTDGRMTLELEVTTHPVK